MSDDYPSDEHVEKVEHWPIKSRADCIALLEFVRGLWWNAEWGFDGGSGTEKAKYNLSTGGWSGNESLIQALQANWMFWSLAWQSSRRGGHYEFEVSR